MTPEERKVYMKKYMKEYYSEHKEKFKAYSKKYYAEHREEYNEWQKKYKSTDLNSSGCRKSTIRAHSRIILLRTHAKIKDYQIHHCFGYEYPSKFIYIPRSLHYHIHRLLRDLNIPAVSNHWNVIRDLVNSGDEYTYIRC